MEQRINYCILRGPCDGRKVSGAQSDQKSYENNHFSLQSISAFQFVIFGCLIKSRFICVNGSLRVQYRYYNTIHYTRIQYITIITITIEYRTVQYSKIQHNTIHYTALQYITIESTVEFDKLVHFDGVWSSTACQVRQSSTACSKSFG